MGRSRYSGRSHPVVRRRAVLRGSCAALLASTGCEGELLSDGARFASAQGSEDGAYELIVADASGVKARFPSDVRGHGLAVHPAAPGRVVMFARRPHRVGIIADVRTGTVSSRFEAPVGRHHSGHGCFSADASVLYVVESDVISGRGFLAVLDSDTLERVAEFETYGLGPHEVVLMPDGGTLAVANGGLVTEPGEREPINLATMESSLVYLDASTGVRLGQHAVAEEKASLRHLAVADDGTIAVAMQVQRDALSDSEPRPLVAIQRPGEALRALEDGRELGTAMEDYAGAVAVDGTSRVAAVTSPRGNVVAFWDLDSGALRGAQPFDNVSGIALSADGATFVLSGSGGQVRHIDPVSLEELPDARSRFGDVLWDNHLVALPV